MRIYIDNIPLAYPQDNLLKPAFSLRRRDEEGFKSFSMTGDLNFIGSDYDYLYSRLRTDDNALENEVELKFMDDCCGNKEYKFNIKADTLEWCENECSLTAAAVEKSDQEKQLRCLRNTLIADNYNGFKNKQHPRFTYCNEVRPQWHHDVVLIQALVVITTYYTLYPIVFSLWPVIFVVVKVVTFLNNNLGTDIDIGPLQQENGEPINPFKEFEKYKNDLLDYLVGCGKKHPSPLVRDYAINVCGKCGLSFSSTIFNQPGSQYYNTCYHFAPVDKGVARDDTSTFWLDKNEPYLNGIMFFDQLKNTFNSEWYILNNVLYFERRDKVQTKTPWLDTTALTSDEFEACYSWSKKPRPAYGVFEYAKDAINSIGSEANRRYGDIVEWNSPPKLTQKGELRPNIEFAACRFRDDGIDRDVLTNYENFPILGNKIEGFKNCILLNQHLCYTPMLLIWDTNTPVEDARVSGTDYFFPGNSEAGLNQYYNYPLWFDQFLEGNMYTNFWYIENPRYDGFQGLDFDVTVELTCERLQAMDLDGMIKTSEGTGKIQEINVNYNTNTINIKGEI